VASRIWNANASLSSSSRNAISPLAHCRVGTSTSASEIIGAPARELLLHSLKTVRYLSSATARSTLGESFRLFRVVLRLTGTSLEEGKNGNSRSGEERVFRGLWDPSGRERMDDTRAGTPGLLRNLHGFSRTVVEEAVLVIRTCRSALPRASLHPFDSNIRNV